MRMRVYIVVMMLILLVSCGKKEEKVLPGKADAKALRVGIVPLTACDPFDEAYQKGLLDSLHADVVLKHYNAFSECRHAIEKGLVDCAVMDSSLLVTINSGLPEGERLNAVPIVCKNPVFHFLTSKKARIRHLSQLTDKMVAADSHGTTHDIAAMAIDSLLRHKQMVFIVQCEDMAVRLDMLNTGNVDAAVLPEPYAAKALKAGATEIPIPEIRQAPIVLAVSPKVSADKLVKLRKTVRVFR